MFPTIASRNAEPLLRKVATQRSSDIAALTGLLETASLSVGGTTHVSVRCRSGRSRRGLYDGKDVGTGNKVSFSMKATKRKFKPNVFKKSVYSETLDEMVRFHLTTSALRSIDKAGGLDNYLMTSRHVTEGEGLAVKKRILAKKAYLQRVAAREAAAQEQDSSTQV